jgi:hypothetical protein
MMRILERERMHRKLLLDKDKSEDPNIVREHQRV